MCRSTVLFALNKHSHSELFGPFNLQVYSYLFMEDLSKIPCTMWLISESKCAITFNYVNNLINSVQIGPFMIIYVSSPNNGTFDVHYFKHKPVSVGLQIHRNV